MLINNAAKYTKNYRLHNAGRATLILCEDIMIIELERMFVIYRGGYLKGTIMRNRSIYTYCPYASWHTKWNGNMACGIWVSEKHNIPFYIYTYYISVYGFQVRQYPWMSSGIDCENLYMTLIQN